jgi:hypothetical protein
MALMHALQSAHTSLESGLLRVLEMLGEERPVGEDWHAALIRRIAAIFRGGVRPFPVADSPRQQTKRAGSVTGPHTTTTVSASPRSSGLSRPPNCSGASFRQPSSSSGTQSIPHATRLEPPVEVGRD